MNFKWCFNNLGWLFWRLSYRRKRFNKSNLSWSDQWKPVARLEVWTSCTVNQNETY